MEIRVYMDALEMLEKEIKGITKKEAINPAELNSLSMALKAAKGIMDIIGDLPGDANDTSSNGYHASYDIRPGFKHEAEYSGAYFPREVYSGYPYSYRRGRSATTGRYVSRGDNYGDAYSGHSIDDRMVAAIEDMYDEAKTDHERQKIDTAIRMIRQSSK